MTQPNKYWPHYLVLGILVLLVFGQCCFFEFVNWDDGLLITQNHLVNPPSLARAISAWTTPHLQLYIPLTYNVWSLLASVGQTQTPDSLGQTINPWVFHIANVLLHLANTILVFQILRSLVRRPWLAALGAAFWAVHPIQVEVVAWATGMKDLLSSFLALWAIWLYLRTAREQKPPLSTRKAYMLYSTAGVILLLATTAKPGIIGVPLMVIALDWLLLERPLKRVLLCALPLLIAVIPSTIITALVQPATGIDPSPAWTRPLIAGHALAFYLQKICWPDAFTSDYGLAPKRVMLGMWVYLAWTLPTLLTLGIICFRTGRKYLSASGLIFLAGVGPVLGLVPFAFQYFSTVADRYLYLSMLGVALALVWALSRLANKWIVPIGGILLVLLGTRSFFQCQTWESSRSLFTNAIKVNPNSFSGYANLAYDYCLESVDLQNELSRANAADPQVAKQQKHALELRDNAEAMLLKANQLNPNYILTLNNLASIYTQKGQFDLALECLERAVDVQDQDLWQPAQPYTTRLVIAQSCANLKQYDRAIMHVNKYLAKHPGDPTAQKLLRDIHLQQQRQPSTRQAATTQTSP